MTEPDRPADAVEVGRVIGAWGVKGWIRILPHASDPQALFSTRRWYLQPATGGAPFLLKISQVKPHGDGVVASSLDLPDRSAAEALKGCSIFVSRASFPSVGSDEFYWVDLIGLDVVNRDDVALGQVKDLLDTGAHSVLVLRNADDEELMIPFVAAYIDDVDLVARRIKVDWGLDF